MIGKIIPIPPAPLAPVNTAKRILLYHVLNQVQGLGTFDTGNINTPSYTRIAIMFRLTALTGTGPTVFFIPYNVNGAIGADGVEYQIGNGANFTSSPFSEQVNIGPYFTAWIPGQTSPPTAGVAVANFNCIILDTVKVKVTVSGTTPSATFNLAVYGERDSL